MQTKSQYSAAASMLGYIYQCRLALLQSLKRLRSDPNIAVAIETLDDVVFEKDGKPTEVIQVKHHISRKASLTNASTDLWKTIRNWCDLFSEGLLGENSILCLMTTETAAIDSAVRLLRVEGRDVKTAENLLLLTSQKSFNEANKKAYAKFNSLTPEERIALLGHVYILDDCPLSKDLQSHLREELWGHCERQHTENFLIYLEGWWLKRVVSSLYRSELKDFTSLENDAEQLTSEKHQNLKITGSEIDAQLDALREQFQSDSLPIHSDIESANPDVTPFSNWVFAKQLRLINLTERRIQRAAKNFYKATEQRSRWVRETLLVDDNLQQYDERLKEEWAIRFDHSGDSMPSNAKDADWIESGQELYRWAEADANFPIRPSCQDHFITRGSYHMLADRLQVGWHQHFKSIITTEVEEENS